MKRILARTALGIYVGGAAYAGAMVAGHREPSDTFRTHAVGVVSAAVLWPALALLVVAASIADIDSDTSYEFGYYD